MSIQTVAKALKINKLPFVTRTYRYLQDKLVTNYGSEVVMDICTICTARCVYCLHQTNRMVKPRIMDYSVFEQIVPILKKDKIKKIHLFQSGEPFINPHIYGMINSVVELGMDCTIGTRLNTNIDLYRLKDIASRSKNTIEFLITIDSFDKSVLVSPGIKMELVKDNIIKMAELLKYKNVKFTFSTIVTWVNEYEIFNTRDELKSLGFKNWYASSMGYYMWNMATKRDIEVISQYIPYNIKYRDRFNMTDGKIVQKPVHCNNLVPTISVDGDVLICCHDMLHTINTGNIIKENSLRKIVKGKKYSEFKQLAHKIQLDICKSCN